MTTKPAAQQLSRMSAGELLSGQPPEWSVPHAMATIRDRVKGQGTHIAVLDDDPTGTQSVHGVPVLTTWESADLRAALRHPSNAFFVLTSSRGRSRPEAAAISQTIATRLADLADELGIDVEAISRSDSTLRGRFPTEIDALQQGFGERAPRRRTRRRDRSNRRGGRRAAAGLRRGAVHQPGPGPHRRSRREPRGARMLSREFQPAKSALEIFVKDMGLVTEAAAGRRFPAPLAATANQLFLIGAAQGYSGDDDSGIVRVFEQWADKPDA